jgi:hypothetical protein
MSEAIAKLVAESVLRSCIRHDCDGTFLDIKRATRMVQEGIDGAVQDACGDLLKACEAIEYDFGNTAKALDFMANRYGEDDMHTYKKTWGTVCDRYFQSCEQLRQAVAKARGTTYGIHGGTIAPDSTPDALGELVKEQTVGGA